MKIIPERLTERFRKTPEQVDQWCAKLDRIEKFLYKILIYMARVSLVVFLLVCLYAIVTWQPIIILASVLPVFVVKVLLGGFSLEDIAWLIWWNSGDSGKK